VVFSRLIQKEVLTAMVAIRRKDFAIYFAI